MQTENQTTGGKNVSDKVNKAAGMTHDKIDRAASAARPAVERTTERAHEAVDKVADRAHQYADTLQYKSEEFREAQEQALDSLRTYVNEHPVAALSMAVAGGFLLSRILSSR